MDSHLLTIDEVAEMLRLNRITIYSYIKEGSLVAVKFGRTYRVSKGDLKEFIKKNKTSKVI